MSHKQKKMLVRIIVSFALLITVRLIDFEGWKNYLLYLIPYAIIGWDVLWRAVRNICHGQVFDENFLMTIATIGAFFTGECAEMLFLHFYSSLVQFCY